MGDHLTNSPNEYHCLISYSVLLLIVWYYAKFIPFLFMTKFQHTFGTINRSLRNKTLRETQLKFCKNLALPI